MDTLWNIIRDFFVKFVFGGIDSFGNFYSSNFLGQTYSDIDGIYSDLNNVNVFVPFNAYDDTIDEFISHISFADWLSTTATIITLIALFIGITILTIKLFKFVSNAISMR